MERRLCSKATLRNHKVHLLCLGAVFSVIHWVCGGNLVYVCPSICPPLCSLRWVFSRWEQRARSSTMPVHKKLKVPFRLAKNAVVSIVICRQPSAAFSPSTITPVASPSHRSCTRVKSSHLSALPSAFVSVCPARWSSSSLKQGMLHL